MKLRLYSAAAAILAVIGFSLYYLADQSRIRNEGRANQGQCVTYVDPSHYQSTAAYLAAVNQACGG
jgi:hypothetical protein